MCISGLFDAIGVAVHTQVDVRNVCALIDIYIKDLFMELRLVSSLHLSLYEL